MYREIAGCCPYHFKDLQRAALSGLNSSGYYSSVLNVGPETFDHAAVAVVSGVLSPASITPLYIDQHLSSHPCSWRIEVEAKKQLMY